MSKSSARLRTSSSIARCAAIGDFSGCGSSRSAWSLTGNQRAARLGIGAGKQRHLMTKPDQSVDQIGDDPLGAAIEFRRHAFIERRDMCDLHLDPALVDGDGARSLAVARPAVCSLTRQSRTSSGSFTRSQAAIASSTQSISSQSCAISASSIASAAASKHAVGGDLAVFRDVEIRREFQHLVMVHRLVGIVAVGLRRFAGQTRTPFQMRFQPLALGMGFAQMKLEARLEIGVILHPSSIAAPATGPASRFHGMSVAKPLIQRAIHPRHRPSSRAGAMARSSEMGTTNLPAMSANRLPA